MSFFLLLLWFGVIRMGDSISTFVKLLPHMGPGARSESFLSNEDFIVVVCLVLFSLWLLTDQSLLCRAPPHCYPPCISFQALLLNI